MTEKKISKQKAGRGSAQIKIDQYVVNNVSNGLSEREVRNIVQAEATKIIAEANESAKQIANTRVDSFSDILIKRLIESDNLEELRNPAMHLIIRKAQEAAICTDDKSDHEMLSELLVYRAEHPNDKNATSSVKKAIAEIDSISKDALDALTISFSIMSFTPVSGFIEDGLQAIDALFGKMLRKISLPTNNDWIENLEITNIIRVSSFGRLKKYEEIARDNFSGYFVLGIKKESDNYVKALDILSANNLPKSILVHNTLDNNYVRIITPSLEKISEMGLINAKTRLLEKFSEAQVKAIKNIIDLYETNSGAFNNMEKRFKELLSSYKSISEVREWWDRLAGSGICFNITPVGRVLANTNAQRIDPNLPDLNNKKTN